MVCVNLQAQRTYTTHSAAWCPVDTRACRDVMHPLTRIVKWLSMCARPCICAMTLKTASRAIRALIPACINRYRLHYVLIPVFACSCTGARVWSAMVTFHSAPLSAFRFNTQAATGWALVVMSVVPALSTAVSSRAIKLVQASPHREPQHRAMRIHYC